MRENSSGKCQVAMESQVQVCLCARGERPITGVAIYMVIFKTKTSVLILRQSFITLLSRSYNRYPGHQFEAV